MSYESKENKRDNKSDQLLLVDACQQAFREHSFWSPPQKAELTQTLIEVQKLKKRLQQEFNIDLMTERLTLKEAAALLAEFPDMVRLGERCTFLRGALMHCCCFSCLATGAFAASGGGAASCFFPLLLIFGGPSYAHAHIRAYDDHPWEKQIIRTTILEHLYGSYSHALSISAPIVQGEHKADHKSDESGIPLEVLESSENDDDLQRPLLGMGGGRGEGS